MAFVNVKEWSIDQVVDWMKGLDSCLQQYLNIFVNNEINGIKLLNLTSSSLDNLRISIIGHQQLLLESIEILKHLHYELDRENLQTIALKLSCEAHSLNRELSDSDENSRLSTQTISDVANLITVVKSLIEWLDKPPFTELLPYIEKKSVLIGTTLKLIWNAKRDNFAEKPNSEIRRLCNEVAESADKIIQELGDPIIIQPAYLELVTLKKSNDHLGFFITENHHGIHQVAGVKFGSPAHSSGKIEEGDEIVQVNYQTVAGWQWDKVSVLFDESSSDILLTIKKRPKHCKSFGQILMQPYQLPNKKRMIPYSKWNDKMSSPRVDLIRVPEFETRVNKKFPSTAAQDDVVSIKSGYSESDNSIVEGLNSVTATKSRPILQRRNTISGYNPTNNRSRNALNKILWGPFKKEAMNKSIDNSFPVLIDKSISCDFGLEKTRLSKTTCVCSKSDLLKNGNMSSSVKQLNFHENPSTMQWKNEIIEELIGSLKKSVITDSKIISPEPSIIKKPKQKPAVPPRTSCSIRMPPTVLKNEKIVIKDVENKKQTIITTPPSDRKDNLVEKFSDDLTVKDNRINSSESKLDSSFNSKSLANNGCDNEEIIKPVLGVNKVPNIRLLSCNNGSTSIKKKNLLRNKRRRVVVKDLVPFDIKGYLYQRPSRSKNYQPISWKKRFFVLFNKALYGFSDKNATKADFLIFLNGFTVSIADEVKSKPHAFKIYHTGKAFYFAVESAEILQMWFEQITNVVHADILRPLDESLISETDDSDSEFQPKKESLSTSNIKESTTVCSSLKKFGSLKKFASRKTTTDSSSSSSINESTSLDRKYLKFFHSSSLSSGASTSSSNSSKSPKNSSVNIPVPTAQFRSYRKVAKHHTILKLS